MADKCENSVKPGDKRSGQSSDDSLVPEKKGKIQFNLQPSKSDSKTDDKKPDVMKKPAAIKMSIGSKGSVAPIKMSLGTKKPIEPKPKLQTNMKVASVFNADDDSDEEEMPAEARMKMRNIGRDTPTAAGPNSFGKGSSGFVDRRALLKKELEEQWNKTVEEEDRLLKLGKS